MEIIKLNLIPSGVNPVCHCSQYDNGRVIRIELFNGLTPYALASGDVVTLKVRKPDNTVVTATVTTTQGNNYVDIVTTEQICACSGNNLCDLTITNGSTVIGTLNFIMQVERDVLSDGIESQSVIRDLSAQVTELAEDAVEPFISELTDIRNGADNHTYSSAGDAVRGQFELNNNNLSRFNAINLIDTRFLGSHTTSGNITFNFSSDGRSCAVSGTATSNTFYNIFFNTSGFPKNMQAGGTYYIKMSGVNVYFWVYYYKSSYVSLIKTNTDAVFTIPSDADGLVIRLSVDKNAVVDETVYFALLNTKSNQELFADIETLSPIVLSDNKNLTRYNSINLVDTSSLGSYTTGGNITFNFNTNGETCAVSGTATSNTFYNIFLNHTAFPDKMSAGGTYYLKFSGINVWYYIYYYDQNDVSHLLVATKTDITFTIPSDAAGLVLRLYVSNGSVVDETVKFALLSGWSNKDLSESADYLKSVVKPTVNNIVLQNLDRKISDNSTKLTRRSGYDLDNVLSKVTWESGNITSSGTETANSNYIRSNYLKTDSGDAFFTKYNSATPNYEMRYYYYDNDYNFIGYLSGHSAFSGDINDQTYATLGEGYVRFTVFKTPADTYTIDPSDISNVDFTLKRLSFKNAEIIRVASNNVRNWGTEHNYGYTGDYESNKQFYEELYSIVQPTYLGLQEFSPYMDAAHNHAAAALFRNLFVNLYHSLSPRTPVLSNLPLSDFASGLLSTGRRYAMGKFTSESNKTIYLFNFHAYPGLTAEAISNRATEFSEILTLLSGKSFIITGDLNVADISELTPFVNAGCNLANGGDFGTFYTGSSAGVSYPFDNVISSSDLKIVYANIADSSGTSDHKLIYADIII